MANEFPEATARLRDPRSDHDYYQRLKETIDALPDNLTDQEADAILQQHGTSAKEVVNGFIEQLLRERLALQEAAEAVLSLKWLRDLALNHRSGCVAITLYDNECNCGLKGYLATDNLLRAALPHGSVTCSRLAGQKRG